MPKVDKIKKWNYQFKVRPTPGDHGHAFFELFRTMPNNFSFQMTEVAFNELVRDLEQNGFVIYEVERHWVVWEKVKLPPTKRFGVLRKAIKR